MSSLTVIYDACILYSAPVRDLFMHLAITGICRAKWTDLIHEEWTSNLLKDFPKSNLMEYDIIAQHPDDFASDLFELDYQNVISACQNQRMALNNPPYSAEEFIDNINNQQLKKFAKKLTGHKDKI